jgi:glycosyltransferase involved in cell wall biosynthesis
LAPQASSTSTKPIRIGIDGGTWSNRRGYGRFLRELLPEVARLRPLWRFTVFLDQPQDDVLLAPNVTWRAANTGVSVSAGAAANSARSVSDLWRMSQAVWAVELDAFWFPTVYSYFPVLGGLPVAVGIHDTMADRYPQWAFAGKRQKLFWDLKVRLALVQAAKLVTVSDYSRQSIADHFSIDPWRIAVVSEGAAPLFRPAARPEEQFLLAVGGISPNKNLQVLIPALAALRAQRPALRLVLVGDYRNDGFRGCYEELRAEAARCQVSGAVEFAGYVPDAELAELYRRCAVFVMPSLEEGFGLPLVEAMACGCACVVAPGHALEEVGGGAVALVKGDWASAIAAVLDDDETRRAMRERAVRRATEYSWERGALALVAVLEEMVAA